MMRFAICEDDELDRLSLVKALAKLREGNIFHDVFNTPDELLESEVFLNGYYDLYILDVEMPRINGIELAKKIREKDACALILFITGHSQYQIEALNLISCGYILKPVSFKKLEEAFVKIKPFIHDKDIRINFASNKIIRSVKMEEINYIYTVARKKFVVTDKEQIETYITTEELLRILPEEYFAQPHKSFIVNMKKIDYIDNESVSLIDGKKIEISKKRKKEFNNRFMQFLERIA